MVFGKSYEPFSTLRLGLLHSMLNETNSEWPERSLYNLGGAFQVKQILAQLVKQRRIGSLNFSNKDLGFLSKTQQRYLKSPRICSSYKVYFPVTTFHFN